MSALAEINALSGSVSAKYEVNSNIVSELSAAGDCVAGTPGKYRPLHASKLGSPAATCNRDISHNVSKTYDKNDSEVITDKESKEQDAVSGEKEVNLVENCENIVELEKSCSGKAKDKVVQRSSPCHVNNDENSDLSTDKARNSSDFDGGAENFKPVDPNNDSCRASEQEQIRTKHKSTKGGILQAVQFHFPKFSLKKSHADKAKEGSVLSDTECSSEKKPGKKKGRRVRIQEEKDEHLEEFGNAEMAKNNENTQIVGSCQGDDLKQDKPILSENDNVKENSQDTEDKKGSTLELTVETDQQVNDNSGVQFDGKMEEDQENNCVVVGTGSTDKTKTSERNVGPTANEPSSVPNSSLASADFYTIPPSSIASSTNPSSFETSSGYHHDDSSTTKQSIGSSLGDDEGSLLAETNTKGETSIEMNSDSITDGLALKPDVIPTDEEHTDGLESPCSSQDYNQSQKASVFSSSNQSSLDTSSPSLASTPERSQKKKSKRRVPILNVALPSFGKKHHQSAKSPEQSSDSDRSGSPSKKFPWKKKSPKTRVAAEAESSGSVDSKAKVQSGLPDEKALEAAEMEVKINSSGDNETGLSSSEAANLQSSNDDEEQVPSPSENDPTITASWDIKGTGLERLDSKVIEQNAALQVPEELDEKWKKEEETEAKENADWEMSITEDEDQDGRLKMSGSLEVHTSSTPVVFTPTDLTDDSEDIGDVSVELTAAEKILKECNLLVEDDSVGDIQFTPDMLSEITKTINAFEEAEEKADKVLDVEAQDYKAGNNFSKLSLDGPKPVNVGCQMSFDDGEGENEGNASEGADVGINVRTGFSFKQEVSEEEHKRSISSSSSSDSEAKKGSVKDARPTEEFEFNPDASVAEPLADIQPTPVSLDSELDSPQSSVPLKIVANVGSPSRDQVQLNVEGAPSGVTSAESGVNVQVLTNKEGSLEPTGEKPALDVKQKTKSKGFWSGFNFHWPKFRGRHSDKVDNSSKNDQPLDESKISLHEPDTENSEEASGLAKASSEVNIRRRSVGNEDDLVLDIKSPSVPDISQREKRAKRKSFTLPNMHMRLPKFSTRKTPKSPMGNKIDLPNPEGIDSAQPDLEGGPVPDGQDGVKAGVSGVGSCEVVVSGLEAMKPEIPSSDTLPEAHSAAPEAVEKASTVQASDTDSREKDGGFSAQIDNDNPPTDGIFSAVPVFVQDEDQESDANIRLCSNKEDIDIDGELQNCEIDFSLPTLNDVQAELKRNLEAETDGCKFKEAKLSNCEHTGLDKEEVSIPINHPEEKGLGLCCGHDIGINRDVGIGVSAPLNSVDLGQVGSLNAESLVEKDVQKVGDGVDGTDACEEGSSVDIHEMDIESKVSAEAECGTSVNIDPSFQLDLPPEEDGKAELEVEKNQMSLQLDEKGVPETDTKPHSPGLTNSPTKHKFKLPSFNFSWPKFHGLHSPTDKSAKKTKTTAAPAKEVSSEIPHGALELEKCDKSVSIEVDKEFAVECELQASVVSPEIDIKGDLERRLGSLEEKDTKNPTADINNDLKVKLNFDFDETPQMSIPEASFKQDKVSVPSNPDFQLPNGSFEAELSSTFLEQYADKDDVKCCATAPIQEDHGNSVDLLWEDEMCSKVQVTQPTFTLSDIKGGLSLGVALSEDGSQSGTDEKMQLEEPHGVKLAEVSDLSDLPDAAIDYRDQSNAETTSDSQGPSPEQSIPVDASDLKNKQGTSTHSLAKSVSSHDSQSNAAEKPKKKGSIKANLHLPKIHIKLRSPRFKSPERRGNEDPKQVDNNSENAQVDSAGAERFQKKPGGKRSKKNRWIPGKSANKGKLKVEYGGKLERPETLDAPREASDLDISLNAAGNVEPNGADHPNWELDLQPSTSAGPSTSTPMKPLLSLNNSAQTTPVTPTSNTSLTIEQAIAVHSTPASPISPQTPPRRPYTVVVAIDFGTTFSGYAYSFMRDSDDIQIMRKWEGGDPGVTNMKTPTTLLLHPDGEFHSFGFTARDYYHDMDHNDALRWLYFDKFKLALHNDMNLNLETELTAANGCKLPAIKVFEHSLRFFRGHAMEELCDQSNDGRFDPEDIRWVLTVPAIWRQPAKQFMREAAYRAGLAHPSMPEQLLIALEPEAASICIRKLRMRELVPDRLSQRWKWSAEKKPEKSNSQVAENITHGTRYMVVDCGGGTVDITVHEVEEEANTLKELHKATGGMYGSVSVDAEFEKLLVDIFGHDFIEEFKIKRPAGWVDLMIAFESRKRNANPYKNNPLNVSLPFSFIDYYKKYTHDLASVEDAIWTYKNRDVTWSAQGMLRLSPEGMQQLFRPAVANIKSLVEGLLNDPQLKGVSYLFLAGGFAQSPLLQTQMKKKFASRLRVIIPRDVGLTILKGAVMFGLDPTAVRVRRSRLTYGVGVLNKFNPEKHPKEKHVVKDSTEWCRDVFDAFVMADQSVALGDKVTRSYTPAKSTQKSIIINIYCTENEKVQFITDEGVQKCGTMHIDVSDAQSTVPSTKRRELQLTMQYGDTEIKVSALDVPTGRCVNSNIDFLSK